MSNYTKGPWFGKKDGKYRDIPWNLDHDDGHDASWAPITTTSGRCLALVVNDDTKRPMDFQDAEMHANAKIIAAAPDLLEALQMAMEMLNRNLPTLDRNVGFCPNIVSATVAAIDAIDIAIAKALA